jgi:FixJ family two-component response regulator
MINEIVILDDDKAITDALKELLLAAGYPTVKTATTVWQAQQALAPTTDLAIIDVVLYRDPDGQGEDFAQWVKQRNKKCLIFLMTGHAELIKSLYLANVDEIIYKNNKMSEIVDVVNKYNVLDIDIRKGKADNITIRNLEIEVARVREESIINKSKIDVFDKKIIEIDSMKDNFITKTFCDERHKLSEKLEKKFDKFQFFLICTLVGVIADLILQIILKH